MLENSGLFHYTTLEGFKGILSKNTLWATHYQFLNDSQELKVALNYIEEIFYEAVIETLDSRLADKTRDFKRVLHSLRGEVENIRETILEPLQNEFYIISFCQHKEDSFEYKNGLLSQWRAYGKGKPKFAIEFDYKLLSRAFENEAKSFLLSLTHDPVTYDDPKTPQETIYQRHEKKLSRVKDLADFLYRDMLGLVTSKEFDEQYKNYTDRALAALLWLLPFIKHNGFKEENEYRYSLVATMISEKTKNKLRPHEKKPEKPRKYREKLGYGDVVPYIEIFEEKKDFKLPIKRIIVGPSREQKQIYTFTQNYLFSNNRMDIKLEKSDIPYLD